MTWLWFVLALAVFVVAVFGLALCMAAKRADEAAERGPRAEGERRMSPNPGLSPPAKPALRAHRSQSEPSNPALGDTGSQAAPAERLTARQMGIGPVRDVPRGIDSTWTLDVPRVCPCRRCSPPVPLEGWSER
jgi:hypothetical protein